MSTSQWAVLLTAGALPVAHLWLARPRNRASDYAWTFLAGMEPAALLYAIRGGGPAELAGYPVLILVGWLFSLMAWPSDLDS